MVTVEVDPVRVESRLAAGEIGCPRCGEGVLAGWGHARARWIEGLADSLRPRRARCRSCRATHVLLPVTVLLRRAYAAERIWAALTARAEGLGHRRVAAVIRVPAATVRGWLRRAVDRLKAVRDWFLGIAVTAGVDVAIPDGSRCPWRDVLAAVETATTAIGFRFGAAGWVGAVTPERVAVAASGGRLLAPGWPGTADRGGATPVAPAAAHDDR
jgi:transposase-like protein